jgi:hypothetical protein
MKTLLTNVVLLTFLLLPQTGEASDEKYVLEDTVAAETKEDLDDLATFADQDDSAAFSAKARSCCISLFKGQKVWRTAVDIWGHKLQIRLPGQTKKYWIFSKFVEDASERYGSRKERLEKEYHYSKTG